MKTMLMAYVKDNHRLWDVNLPELGCAIRTAKHEVTGQTPYFINFGCEMMTHGSEYHLKIGNEENKQRVYDRSKNMNRLRDWVKKRIDKASDNTRERYNLRRRDVHFKENDLVWKKNYVLSDKANYFTSKFADRFVGPFRVKRKVGYCTYELINDNGKSIGHWHVKDLKPHPQNSDSHVESDSDVDSVT
ncbi:uncharacterized protein LOC126879835 [Diabrotica virgifera virgifera]|nr:uncharacterized protein LOC126879835 [Diabrotica virgifera virgifera]